MTWHHNGCSHHDTVIYLDVLLDYYIVLKVPLLSFPTKHSLFSHCFNNKRPVLIDCFCYMPNAFVVHITTAYKIDHKVYIVQSILFCASTWLYTVYSLQNLHTPEFGRLNWNLSVLTKLLNDYCLQTSFIIYFIKRLGMLHVPYFKFHEHVWRWLDVVTSFYN
jgi:hypothetical protein